MLGAIRRFCGDESGATAIEYALMSSLIAVAIIVSVRSMGSQLAVSYTNIGNAIK